jgi:hypothetical protein
MLLSNVVQDILETILSFILFHLETYRSRPGGNINTGYPYRTNFTISLRSDGLDSEVLNRLEHSKGQLKDTNSVGNRNNITSWSCY